MLWKNFHKIFPKAKHFILYWILISIRKKNNPKPTKNPTTQQIKTLWAETSPALHSCNNTWASLPLAFWCLMRLKSSELIATDMIKERNKNQVAIITALLGLGTTFKSNCEHDTFPQTHGTRCWTISIKRSETQQQPPKKWKWNPKMLSYIVCITYWLEVQKWSGLLSTLSSLSCPQPELPVITEPPVTASQAQLPGDSRKRQAPSSSC